MDVKIDLKQHIRTIPHYPIEGVMFRDVTTLFSHGPAFAAAIEQLSDQIAPSAPDVIVGIEARGFVLGGAIAVRLGLGFAPVRKKGKLPSATIAESYELEYGSAEIEMHTDAIGAGARVALIDDLIATGGTGLAAINLVRRLGGEPVAFAALIDLPELGGAEKIRAAGAPVMALMAYEGH